MKRVWAFLLIAFLFVVPSSFGASGDVTETTGTQLLVANSTYNPADTNNDLGASITDDIDMVGLTTGQAREGVKIDFGANRATSYHVRMAMEFATDPTGTMDLYWSSSQSATAAVGNTGQATGADADYAGYDTLTLDEALKHMVFIGALVCGLNNTADGVQIGNVNTSWSPPTRYGVLIVHNNTNVTLHSDSVEMAVAFDPILINVAP